jgi:Tfp pilus assembly protein PilN
MRELEFLPSWYPQTRRRRRLVLLQGWLTFIMVIAMGGYLALADRNIRTSEDSLSALKAQLAQTATQIDEMEKLDALRKQWRQQFQIMSRLGLYVEACTMVHTLDSVMPRQMSLTSVHFENEEKVETSAVLAAKVEQAIDRKLKARIQGVCPTDVDLANFMTKLTEIPFFEQVNITYAKERTEANHVMREFEVCFTINLNGN